MHIMIMFMKKIITNSKFLMIMIFFLVSCKKPKIYFDISKQELIECSNYGLKDVTIDNDSIDENGFAIEPTIQLIWKGTTQSPFNISLNSLPKSYEIISNDKNLSHLKLMKNSSYKISYHVIGKQDFEIKVWTNKNGDVYKTSNENCQ